MAQKKDNEYRMSIGETVLGIECPSAEYASELEEYFGVKSTAADPHVSLRLEIIAHEDVPEIPNSLFAGKKVTGEGFSIAGDLISGSFDSESGVWDVRVKNILTKSIGSSNPHNVIKATMEGLMSLMAPDEIARNRGMVKEEEG